MNRQDLRAALVKYGPLEDEKALVIKFIELLRDPDAYQRDHLPGHITGSAWIVDTHKTHALLTHHAKLDKWLQPGGHADGDENILRVAMREAKEETGLLDITFLTGEIFDLDIHIIPARDNFPTHWHYDVRFLLQADRNQPLVVTQESHDLSWIPITLLGRQTESNTSILRMAHKVMQL